MIRISEDKVKEGEEVSGCLMDASIRYSMGGVGGCKYFNINDFPERFHQLILLYVNNEMAAVEAIYLAMKEKP